MTTTTIYALSRGHYSDYRVSALFPTQELAEQALALDRADEESYGDAFIETFQLHDAVPEPITMHFKTVTIWDDGTTTHHTEYDRTALPWNHLVAPHRVHHRYIRAPIHNDQGGRLTVHGTDLEAVRRTFSDRRAELLATPQQDPSER